MRPALFLLLFLCLCTSASAATFPDSHGDPPTVAGDVERMIAADASFGPSVTSRAASYSMSSGWCGTSRTTDDPTNSAGSNAAQFKIVYVYAADQPNRLTTYAPTIQRYARFASQTLTTASNGVWGIRFDTGLACDPGAVDILTVPLSGAKGAYLGSNRLSLVRNEVMNNSEVIKLKASGPKNFIVYADGLGENYAAAGEGEMYTDDRPGQENQNAKGGLVSVVWGKGGNDFLGDVTPGSAAEVMLHELSHNLGAVQLSSKNSSGYLHCSDETDVMCYNDGTPTREVCQQEVSAFDCNRDDYFNPTGSIIGVRGSRAGQPIWNVANSPFLCPASACTSTLTPPSVSISASTTTPASGQPITLTANWTDPDGYVKQFAWDLDGNGSYEYTSPSVGQLGSAFLGTTNVGVRVTDNDGLVATANLQITPSGSSNTGGAGGSSGGSSDGPSAALTIPSQAQTMTAFTISAAKSQGTGLSYVYDLDGDGDFEYPGAAAVAASYPTAGVRTISVLVTDRSGNTDIASKKVTIAGSSGKAGSNTNITLKATLTKQAIADAIKKGVPTKLTSTQKVKLTVTVTDSKSRKLYGKKTLTVSKGTTSTRVALTAAAKRALKRKSKVVVSIQGAALTPAVVSASVKSSLLKKVARK